MAQYYEAAHLTNTAYILLGACLISFLFNRMNTCKSSKTCLACGSGTLAMLCERTCHNCLIFGVLCDFQKSSLSL